MVYRLVSHNTVEDKVVALAKRKAALFRGVMDDGDLFAGQITAADISTPLGQPGRLTAPANQTVSRLTDRDVLVDDTGLEPVTSALSRRRSPS